MKSILALALAAGALFSGVALAAEKVSFAYLKDPAVEAVMYGIKTGKVKSDKVEAELRPLAVPALIQATMTKQYDIVQSSALSLPDAQDKGLKLAIVGVAQRLIPNGDGMALWVRNDSPVKSIADLKGKSLGITGLRSMGTSLIRIALWKKHGLNTSVQGGDIRFIEMPGGNLPGALATGRIDATNLVPTQAIAAREDKTLRRLGDISRDLQEIVGTDIVFTLLVGYPERLQAKPDAYREFLRMLKQSSEYALANRDEVFKAIGQEYNMPPAVLEAWFTRYLTFSVEVGDSDRKSIARVWQLCKELNVVGAYPDVDSVIWSGALKR
ncbi:MAG TPA: MqnA/MqnD/SBP family protein [Ramlibacter sp.]|nr:MqnA/MqnD/SBP family protein [Ramlibacter sp.]